MGFLAPLFLVAAIAVAVPLLVHLFHLRSGERRAFPALRYLRRTEREHARRIRIRQILLLLLRISVILLLVLAGARLFLRGGGEDHEPTAVAVVLDNSLSSGVVVGDERVLDGLKRSALAGLETAQPEDRIWVLRAGEPWEPPVPSTPSEARRRIRDTRVRGVAPSLPRTVALARSLVASSGMPAAEVHLLSDLQASGFPEGEEVVGDGGGAEIPVLVLDAPGAAPSNRYVAEAEVGAGLPPLSNQTTQISARVEAGGGSASETGGPTGEAEDTVRVRLILDGRIAGAADAPLGTTVLLPAGPFAPNEVRGAVEIDPDALRSDDRRYFVFRVRPPPRVATAGEPGVFVDEALTVLGDADRIRRTGTSEADVLVAGGNLVGEIDSSGPPVVVLPPDDPAILPATNRWLRESGVPWRLEAEIETGEASIVTVDLPVPLEGIRVRRAYRLATTSGEEAGDIRARRSTGGAWIVGTETGEGRPVLLLGSPLRTGASDLPVSPEMLPLVEWMVSGWPSTFRTTAAAVVGDPLELPARATEVRDPDGTLHRVDGRQPFRSTGSPGVYEVLDGDSVLGRRAVNVPAAESLLERIDLDMVLRRLPPARAVDGPEAWSTRVFLQRRGREPWRPLLWAALVLLIGEALLAAAGRSGSPPERAPGSGVSTRAEGADVT